METVYIEEDGELIAMKFNGTHQRKLSVIYPKSHKKYGHSIFITKDQIITDTDKWYDEKERVELNLEIKKRVVSCDFDLITARALAKFLKI